MKKCYPWIIGVRAFSWTNSYTIIVSRIVTASHAYSIHIINIRLHPSTKVDTPHLPPIFDIYVKVHFKTSLRENKHKGLWVKVWKQVSKWVWGNLKNNFWKNTCIGHIEWCFKQNVVFFFTQHWMRHINIIIQYIYVKGPKPWIWAPKNWGFTHLYG